MHEGAIAESIVDILKDTAKENKLNKITKVALKIGKMSGVMIDALLFALDALRNEESIIEDAKFEVVENDIKAHCFVCDKDFYFEELTDIVLVCPDCSMPLEIIEGKEMEIIEIEGE
ncbi:hydrogenase maturation nickel metallochaperone HypA [Hippea alviniae]|uniref:hydrogenase maturation nickel metallochaperone HypA/HybF n=1 Tax=Hippea alviniae TaxID=1279027 RepID=UPI0003B62E43|nr:hydrogenase maturation nickel metallochaperone HypA [Hippea alviniae]